MSMDIGILPTRDVALSLDVLLAELRSSGFADVYARVDGEAAGSGMAMTIGITVNLVASDASVFLIMEPEDTNDTEAVLAEHPDTGRLQEWAELGYSFDLISMPFRGKNGPPLQMAAARAVSRQVNGFVDVGPGFKVEPGLYQPGALPS